MFRQGDVLLIPTGKPTRTGKAQPRDDRGRIVLAEGEATGHAHAIASDTARLYGAGLDVRFLQVIGEATLTHEEHDTIVLPDGWYEVRRQREYTPEAERFVAD